MTDEADRGDAAAAPVNLANFGNGSPELVGYHGSTAAFVRFA